MATHDAPPRIKYPFSVLRDTKMPAVAGEPMSEATQTALLVGAGILAIHPTHKFTNELGVDPAVFLAVPNLDAAQACQEMLSSAAFASADHEGEGAPGEERPRRFVSSSDHNGSPRDSGRKPL